jgi:peptidoglycan/LPS O-acetylase OafA/YrhL
MRSRISPTGLDDVMTITVNDGQQSLTRLAPDRLEVQPSEASAPNRPAEPASRPVKRGVSKNGHVTALDGMRGVAVLLVLLFHFKIGPFRGGFVGVTVFFTLSGFLICSRTLTEVGRSSGFAVKDFFERRIRRLAPAAIVCVLGVVIATNLIGTREQHASVTGDALAALANVANWRFLVNGTSYTDLFAAPSPLNHFWSLAIEEQFYLVFPVAVWLLMKLPPRVRAMSVAAVVSVALEWSAHAASGADSYNRFYYGTDARMSELLIGVIAALTLSYWRIPLNRPAGRQRFTVTLLAAAALVTIVVGAMTYRNGAVSYQHGGAVIIALATAVLIIGGLEGANGVARLLSARWLVWVGKVSYGAYLYHWPIFALSGKHWGPLHGLALGLAQLCLSLLIAGASFRYLESPIQRRRFAPLRPVLMRSWLKALAGVAILAVALALVHPVKGASRFSPAGSSAAAQPGSDPTGATVPGLEVPARTEAKPGTVVAPTNAAVRPLRVLVTGDSTARVMANALVAYQNAHPKALQVLDLSLPGCPITPTDLIRNYSGESGQNVSLCAGWQTTFPKQIKAFQPDVSAVFLSVMEQTDQRRLSAGWSNLMDPAYRAQQEAEFIKFADLLGSTGAPVVWADAPYAKFQIDLPWLSDSPVRTDTLNQMYRDIAAKDSKIILGDYASKLNRPGHVVDASVRPDGIHMTDAWAAKVATSWLIPSLAKYKPKPS